MGSAILATRKGVFVLEKSASRWDVARASFLGDNYSLATADSASGRWHAAADLGHFGVKLQRSENRGETWTEIGAPAYPPKPEDEPEKDQWGKEVPWKVLKVPVDCFVPKTPARHGRFSNRSGIIRSARTGSAAGPINQASIRSLHIPIGRTN
jgi:hypothetical protein